MKLQGRRDSLIAGWLLWADENNKNIASQFHSILLLTHPPSFQQTLYILLDSCCCHLPARGRVQVYYLPVFLGTHTHTHTWKPLNQWSRPELTRKNKHLHCWYPVMHKERNLIGLDDLILTLKTCEHCSGCASVKISEKVKSHVSWCHMYRKDRSQGLTE